MIVHQAAWVLPIAAPPIQDGWVAVERGRIVGLGGRDELPRDLPTVHTPASPAAPVAILPGLVNAHTHLEFSWAAGQVPPAASMPEWAAALMALRRTVGSEPEGPIADAIGQARACGTTLVGDIGNTLAAYEPLAHSPLSACIFHELLGFNATDPGSVVSAAQKALNELTPVARLRLSLVPHAPYSVSPALFAAIAGQSRGRPLSVHLGESAEEIEFLRQGTGAWRRLLEALGAWSPVWTPPGCGPVEYLERLGALDGNLIAVHAVQLSAGELDRLARAGATLVTCPRSNRWTGAGVPPIERFFASGARVAVGTDSLASVGDLNLFHELAAIRALAPAVPARVLLESATRNGADALGFGADLGTIERGKRADLISVAIPSGVPDVEEYLVGPVQPDAIRWLEAG